MKDTIKMYVFEDISKGLHTYSIQVNGKTVHQFLGWNEAKRIAKEINPKWDTNEVIICYWD